MMYLLEKWKSWGAELIFNPDSSVVPLVTKSVLQYLLWHPLLYICSFDIEKSWGGVGVFNQSWHLEHNLFCRILRLTQGIFGSQMGFLNCWVWFFGFFANHCTECWGSQNPDSSSNILYCYGLASFITQLLGKKTAKFL